MNVITKFLSKTFTNESKITSERLAKPCPSRRNPRHIGMVQHTFEFEFHFLSYYDSDNFLFSGPTFWGGLLVSVFEGKMFSCRHTADTHIYTKLDIFY